MPYCRVLDARKFSGSNFLRDFFYSGFGTAWTVDLARGGRKKLFQWSVLPQLQDALSYPYVLNIHKRTGFKYWCNLVNWVLRATLFWIRPGVDVKHFPVLGSSRNLGYFVVVLCPKRVQNYWVQITSQPYQLGFQNNSPWLSRRVRSSCPPKKGK